MALVTKTKRRPPAHVKKRSGQHHQHNKHYVKAYWPYIPMAAIVMLGITVNSAWSKQAVLGAHSDFSSSSLLADTNQQRQSNSEPALSINTQLEAAAQTKANDMATRNYWSHNTPDGKTPWTFMSSAGYAYQKAGENLAYGFSGADQTVSGWMNSPEHRANILDDTYSNVGFGVATSVDYQGKGPETIVVALYAQPVQAAANITFSVPQQTAVDGNVKGATSEPAARLVSRVQLITNGQAPWSLLVVSVIASSALTLFALRHGMRFRRLVSKGELFIVTHPLVDISIVFVVTAAFVLTRTSGIIR